MIHACWCRRKDKSGRRGITRRERERESLTVSDLLFKNTNDRQTYQREFCCREKKVHSTVQSTVVFVII